MFLTVATVDLRNCWRANKACSNLQNFSWWRDPPGKAADKISTSGMRWDSSPEHLLEGSLPADIHSSGHPALFKGPSPVALCGTALASLERGCRGVTQEALHQLGELFSIAIQLVLCAIDDG